MCYWVEHEHDASLSNGWDVYIRQQVIRVNYKLKNWFIRRARNSTRSTTTESVSCGLGISIGYSFFFLKRSLKNRHRCLVNGRQRYGWPVISQSVSDKIIDVAFQHLEYAVVVDV